MNRKSIAQPSSLLAIDPLSGMSFKAAAVLAVRDGRAEAVRPTVPEGVLGEWDEWVEEVEYLARNMTYELTGLMLLAPRDRDEFARWARQQEENWPQPLLFAWYENQDTKPLVFDLIGRLRVEGGRGE